VGKPLNLCQTNASPWEMAFSSVPSASSGLLAGLVLVLQNVVSFILSIVAVEAIK